MTMMKMNEQIRAKQESARKQLHKMLNRRQGDISIFYRGQHLTVHQKQMMSYYFMCAVPRRLHTRAHTHTHARTRTHAHAHSLSCLSRVRALRGMYRMARTSAGCMCLG